MHNPPVMRKRHLLWLPAAGLAVLIGMACGGGPLSPPVSDGQFDDGDMPGSGSNPLPPGHDGGATDARHDAIATTDAGQDSATDAPATDGSPADTGSDAQGTADAAGDAGTDAGDAATDA